MKPLQRRILLELSGRQEEWVSTRDLCDALGVEYADFDEAKRALWLGNLIGYQANLAQSSNPWWSITWIGRRWLTDHPMPTPKPRRHWFRRGQP